MFPRKKKRKRKTAIQDPALLVKPQFHGNIIQETKNERIEKSLKFFTNMQINIPIPNMQVHVYLIEFSAHLVQLLETTIGY